MLTKGIIVNKSINSGKYLVRVPYLENAGKTRNCNLEATVAVVPGVSESFAPDDVVILGFEDHQPDKPIIVGKLFIGEEEARGYAKFSAITVQNSARLPANTFVGNINLYETLEYLLQRVGSIEDDSNYRTKIDDLN